MSKRPSGRAEEAGSMFDPVFFSSAMAHVARRADALTALAARAEP
jgi:hypothetical protein